MQDKQTPNPYAKPASDKPVYAKQKNNTLAISSLVLGILSLFFYFLTAIPSIITGHMARSRVKKSPDEYSGKGMALAGLIISYIMLVVSAIMIASVAYLFSSSPEFKDAFMEGLREGTTGVN